LSVFSTQYSVKSPCAWVHYFTHNILSKIFCNVLQIKNNRTTRANNESDRCMCESNAFQYCNTCCFQQPNYFIIIIRHVKLQRAMATLFYYVYVDNFNNLSVVIHLSGTVYMVPLTRDSMKCDLF
jgi:hypothetical protein